MFKSICLLYLHLNIFIVMHLNQLLIIPSGYAINPELGTKKQDYTEAQVSTVLRKDPVLFK